MPVRIAVIGTGHMGRHHAAKVAELRNEGGATFAGIADIDPDRRRRVAAETGAHAAASGRELFGEADAAIVAVPTIAHYEVVRAALEAGLDVLVEKPIAASVGQAEELLALARRGGRILQVGSQEWYNPALRAIRAKIQRPRFVEGHRVGPFSERGADIDVVRDLMIHDLDILQKLLGEAPQRIAAVGVPVVTDKVDIANARIAFSRGCVANLTASRVSVKPMRKIRFFQRDGYFSIDFLAQSAAIFRRVESKRGDPPRVEKEALSIDREDPLRNQLRAFLHAVETRDLSASTGDEALVALRTALRVVDAMPSVEDPA
jgi:predicted dehydrogenase